MAKKEPNVEWFGMDAEQSRLLDQLDFIGNNGWGRNSQTEALMPGLLGDCAEAGLSIDDVVQAMATIGYGKGALHQLRRWESKRTTGRFDPPRPRPKRPTRQRPPVAEEPGKPSREW